MENTANQVNNGNSKIYTLSKPPTPEEPFLHPVRHARIIKHFHKEGNAFQTLNSAGEVDFYLLLSWEDDYDELPGKVEEFGLNTRKKGGLDLDIFYDNEIKGTFRFELSNPLDFHSLKGLAEKKRVNIYYISFFEDEYVCTGMKTVYLSGMLCYDITRCLEGKRPLLLPQFSDNILPDRHLTESVLLQKAWGFYIDYSLLVDRMGGLEETEEIVSRHILDGIARLQKSRRKRVQEDWFLLWVGRKITIIKDNEPRECYSIYLTGRFFSGDKKKDLAHKVMENSLKELPEYHDSAWVSPLAEEGVPLAIITEGQLFRLNLTHDFYNLSQKLFQKHYLPFQGYLSYYQKIFSSQVTASKDAKIYDFLDKRREKYEQRREDLSAGDILHLIRRGKEEDLPLIFANLDAVTPMDIDEVLVSLCEKYKKKVEPYLLPLLYSPRHAFKAMAILGLGMIESVEAVPGLVDSIKGSRREASLAKYALALIGDPAFPYLLPLLNDKRAEIRIRGIETLALLGTPQALSAIREMKNDRSMKVEQAKRRVLSKYGDGR